jgi:hypothetical protein
MSIAASTMPPVRVDDTVLSERRAALATEFIDAVHSVERAVRMGSVTEIVDPASLRPFLIEAVQRGMARTLTGLAAHDGAPVADLRAG